MAVLNPTGSWKACFAHPAADHALMAPSLRPASAIATLTLDASREDADVIAAGLTEMGSLDVEVRLATLGRH